MRILAAAATAALLITTPIALGAQSTSGQNLAPETRGAYLAVAGANNLFMVKAAEIAREKARRPEVRRFAETMLTEHQANNEALLEAARAAGGLEVYPPAMMPMHWEMLRRLRRASGSRFDRIYIGQQVETLEVAIELHRNFHTNGTGEQLKAVAQADWPQAIELLAQARALDN